MKAELQQFILNKLRSKIHTLELLILDLRNSNHETKSSMGDKYETSREMVQQEIVRVQNQLNEVLSQLSNFQKIIIKQSESIVLGSYVETSMGNFCISISLGELLFDEHRIFVMSQETPLSKVLLGKRIGDTFVMNGKNFVISFIE